MNIVNNFKNNNNNNKINCLKYIYKQLNKKLVDICKLIFVN
jgi:hypothetical protein